MSTPIEFERETQTARFYSPLQDFAEDAVDTEVRIDPLTGRQSRIVQGSFVMPDEDPEIAPAVEDDEGCFFCPGMVTEATPEYPDWVGTDRGTRGEATAFPNLNPYGSGSNVVALTEDHFVPIDGFTPALLEDGLALALEYVRAVREAESADYASANMNYLPSAGSSIVHPHLQTLVDDRGTNEQRLLARESERYRDEHGSAYWHDLVEEERGGDRHVGTTGNVEWVAPFAPKHHRQVLGIVGAHGIPDPDADAVADIAEGLVNVFDVYESRGMNSFNFALYLQDDPAFPPVVSVISRAVFDDYYWSDSPFFTVLHDEGVVDDPPEEYAEAASEAF